MSHTLLWQETAERGTILFATQNKQPFFLARIRLDLLAYLRLFWVAPRQARALTDRAESVYGGATMSFYTIRDYSQFPIIVEDTDDDLKFFCRGPIAVNRDEALRILASLQQFYVTYPQEAIDRYNEEMTTWPKPVFEPVSAYVYLIKGRGGLYKIGMTGSLETRMSALRSQWKTEIEIIHTVFSKTAHDLEYSLHQYFRDKAVGNEWFHFSDEDVAQAIERM